MQSQFFTRTFSNGLTLVAERIESVRSAGFQFLLPTGAVLDPEGLEGAGYLLEGLAYRGAGERDSRAFSDALDRLGIQRGGGVELECFSFGGALLADDLKQALGLYADLLRRPLLPADQLQPERDLAHQKLARIEDNPSERLFVHLRRAYYDGAFGRIPLGTRESLDRVEAAHVEAEHSRRFRPSGAVLAVAGRFAWDSLCGAVEELFGDWNGETPPLPVPAAEGRVRYLHIPQETNQEQIGLAYPSIPVGHPDYYQLRMAIEILSGGPAARLHTEVREKRGLCYSVRAFPQGHRGYGAVWAYAGTTPERCQETLDVLIQEIRRLEEGVEPAEVERGKTLILSALVMQSEATRSRVGRLSRDQYLLGRVRPLEEVRAGIEAVTPESVGEFLSRHRARDFTVVTLGPRELEVSG